MSANRMKTIKKHRIEAKKRTFRIQKEEQRRKKNSRDYSDPNSPTIFVRIVVFQVAYGSGLHVLNQKFSFLSLFPQIHPESLTASIVSPISSLLPFASFFPICSLSSLDPMQPLSSSLFASTPSFSFLSHISSVTPLFPSLLYLTMHHPWYSDNCNGSGTTTIKNTNNLNFGDLATAVLSNTNQDKFS